MSTCLGDIGGDDWNFSFFFLVSTPELYLNWPNKLDFEWKTILIVLAVYDELEVNGQLCSCHLLPTATPGNCHLTEPLNGDGQTAILPTTLRW